MAMEVLKPPVRLSEQAAPERKHRAQSNFSIFSREEGNMAFDLVTVSAIKDEGDFQVECVTSE